MAGFGGGGACGQGPTGCTLPQCAHRQAVHVSYPLLSSARITSSPARPKSRSGVPCSTRSSRPAASTASTRRLGSPTCSRESSPPGATTTRLCSRRTGSPPASDAPRSTKPGRYIVGGTRQPGGQWGFTRLRRQSRPLFRRQSSERPPGWMDGRTALMDPVTR